MPLIDTDEEASLKVAQSAIDAFPSQFETAYVSKFKHKLGLQELNEDDTKLISGLLDLMENATLDFTNTFRALSYRCADADTNEQSTTPDATSPHVDSQLDAFFKTDRFVSWQQQWHSRQRLEATNPAEREQLMRQNNPAYIPRNHQIEQVISAAIDENYEPMHALMSVLNRPYTEQAGMDLYAQPPKQNEIVQATFCGT